ncbi:hypothetical protein Godav_008852 [Gossypium davidsonii]|uniref:Uncharacterized protein n=2 Tax=Gossypium TaxID=3633 RepID=A0A7J8SBB9_GOSDV|nr:hypothetical protein [Gossypium davidsonii]MBA0658931.1 hypothetical protein [Gossypium klotzschianum]
MKLLASGLNIQTEFLLLLRKLKGVTFRILIKRSILFLLI